MTRTENYARAMEAEPDLKAIERLVDALCSLTRPDDVMCASCAWEDFVKPLVTPMVGWQRGYLPKSAEDPLPGGPMANIKAYGWRDILDLPERERVEATSETEEWLRSSEAFDAVTDTWLAKLEAADPANGHGLRGKALTDS